LLFIKQKPSAISNVLLKVIEWIIQLMQYLTHHIPSQGEATNQGDQRNVCVAGEAPHTHMIAALPEMLSGKVSHFGVVCLTKPLNMMDESDTKLSLHKILQLWIVFLDTVEDPLSLKY